MSQIDISKWKKFKVGHILAKVNTTKLKYRTRDLPKSSEGIYKLPASTSSTTNQGLSVYVPKENATILSNCLLVLANGDAGTVFYESKPFTILQDSYALNLTDNYKSHSSMNIYLYLASVLTKLFHRHFGWDNKAVWNRAKELTIQLPVDKNGDPDWQYMDTYIAKLTTLAHKNVSSLKQAKTKPVKLNIDRWGEFKLAELFEPEFTDGDNKVGQLEKDNTGVNLIGPLSSNNGILGKFISNTKIFSKNTLTWDMFGTCYWQKEPYQTVSHGHVLVLNPKVQINSASLLYLATILTKLGHQKQFGYTNMLTINKYNKLHIKLPIDAKGEPDWQYMDQYINGIIKYAKTKLSVLQ